MEVTFHLKIPGSSEEIKALERQLDADKNVIRHPQHSEKAFVVCASPFVADLTMADLCADPCAALGGQGVLILYEEEITVHQLSSQIVISKIETFLLPILKKMTFRAIDEFGDDRTHKYSSNPEKLFR